MAIGETLAKAQAAANEKRARVYVYQSININGHESSWFNFNGVNDTPNAKLVDVLEPQTGENPA